MVLCEDCKFANWDAELFRDREEGHWEGMHYIPPYSEQFDFYCSKHEQFYMEQDAPECQDGEFGDNNYHEVCKEHERQIKEFKEDLLIKKAKKCPYYGCADTRSVERGEDSTIAVIRNGSVYIEQWQDRDHFTDIAEGSVFPVWVRVERINEKV